MPKIPLFSEQRVDLFPTAGRAQLTRRPTLDPRPTMQALEAQAEADDVLTKEALNLGTEFLQKRIKNKDDSISSAYKNEYALIESEVDKIRTEAEEEIKKGAYGTEGKVYSNNQSYNEDTFIEKKVQEYYDGWFDNFSKKYNLQKRHIKKYGDTWNNFDKKILENESIANIASMKTEKENQQIIIESNTLRKQGKFEEADALIDGLSSVSEANRYKYKTEGYYNYYLNKGVDLATSGNVEEFKKIQEEALNDNNEKITFSQREQLKIQFRSTSKAYFSSVATKNVSEFNTLYEKNELTEDIIKKSNVDDITKKYYINKVILQDAEVSSVVINKNSTLYSVEKSISEKGKKETNYNEIKDIPDGVIGRTGNYSGDLEIAVKNVLLGKGIDGKSKSQDFTKDLNMLISLIGATDAEGNPLMTDNMKERLTAPLFKVMSDEKHNNIFVSQISNDTFDANSYDEVENFAIALFLDAISNIENVSISKKLDGIVTARESLDLALEEIRNKKNEGVVYTTTKSKSGKTNYYDYKDDVKEAINVALSSMNGKVSKELFDKYYNPPSDSDESLFNRLVEAGIIPENEKEIKVETTAVKATSADNEVKKRALPAGKKNR